MSSGKTGSNGGAQHERDQEKDAREERREIFPRRAGDPWRVEAKLRYRIGDGGKLSIWYELVRPHKVIEAAVKELRATIATDTGLNILVGSLG